MADLGPVTWPPAPIRTERLTLRVPEARDRAAVIELLASPEVGTYLGGAQSRDELERTVPTVPSGRPGRFVVDLDPAMIGMITLDRRGAARRVRATSARTAGSGWAGHPIDVVRMPDGGLMTIDNTRVVAAGNAGIDVQAIIHPFDEPLPNATQIDRFTTPKGVPATWGDAIMLRIGKQSAAYRKRWPMGSAYTSWDGN